MWILKNSKDLLDNLKSRSFSQVSPIKLRGTIRTHWYADDLLKQCPSKGDKYVIDQELQHTDHFFLGVACETVYSRSGINHMWLLKNSKDLLDNLKSRSFSQVFPIKLDFSTLYTTLPHDK
jgi:hypothetical protein